MKIELELTDECYEHIIDVLASLDEDVTVEDYIGYCIELSSATQFFTSEEHELFFKMIERVEDENNN